MNVEIGTEATQFAEKEYINGIFVAVYMLVSGGLLALISLTKVLDLHFSHTKPSDLANEYERFND